MPGRRGPKPAAETTTESPKEETVTATTEQPTQPATEPEVTATEPEQEEVIDLTGFEAAANKAVEARDTSTGTVPEGELPAVNAEYGKLKGAKAKKAAKDFLAEQMKAAIMSTDAVKARAFMDLQQGLTATKPAAEPKPPADPTEAFVERVVAFTIANTLVTGDVPEGVSPDWQNKAGDLLAEVGQHVDNLKAWQDSDDEAKGDAPEVPNVVTVAFKLASGRAARLPRTTRGQAGTGHVGPRYNGPARSIANHITEAFADKPSGTFLSVAEITKFKSTEYGTDTPSAGAINVRLFPAKGECNVEGITPVTEPKRGATKN